MRLTAIATCTLALILGASSVAAAAAKDPNQKTTVTDIQYRISYSVEIPGNCAVLAFSQWEAAKFKGWEATGVSVNYGTADAPSDRSFPISPAPAYDDMLPYGGNIVSPPAGSHWVLIGDGSFRAGGPPADPDCTDMLGRVQKVVPDNKVTTTFSRTSECAAKYSKLATAKKAVKKAKGKKAKAKAKKKQSKASKAFGKTCSA